MRFLFVTGNYKPAVNSGGPVNSVSALAETLVYLGHTVTVIALNEDAGMPMAVPLRSATCVEGVEVIYFEAGHTVIDQFRAALSRVRPWEAAAFEWLDSHIKEFDFVHLHLGLLQPANWLAKRCQALGIPLGYHQRGNLDPRRFGRLKWLKSAYIAIVEVPVLRRCAVLFALSEREEEVYRSLCPGASVARLPNGVDSNFWSAEEHKLTGDEKPRKGAFSAVWSARWDLRKGPLEFIEMAIRLKADFPEARFIMMGPERGADLEVVRERLARDDAAGIELYIGLSAEERRKVLNAADYFVLPTQGEGFSVGILEALAAGCCVVTTAEANFPELEGQLFGRICAADPEEMAEVIIDDSQGQTSLLRSASRAAALTFVEEYFDWKAITIHYLKVVCR